MSTNEKKPRRTFDQDFIDGAVKLVTQEGYSLAAAAKAVDVPYTTLRQWCQKQSAKRNRHQISPTSDKARVEQLEAENRQLRKQLRQAELEREILKKATAYFAKESQ
jgi:transposase